MPAGHSSRPQQGIGSESDASQDSKISSTASGKAFRSDQEGPVLGGAFPLPSEPQPSWQEKKPRTWWLTPLSGVVGQTTKDVYGDVEKAGHRMVPRRRLWVRFGIICLVVLVLVVALSAGLGAGLKRRHHSDHGPSPSSLSTVKDLVDDSQEGLAQNGIYRTSYTNVSNVLAFDGAEKLAFASSPLQGPDLVLQLGKGTDMTGFGATLTDASAMLLSQLKIADSSNYKATLNAMFNRRSGLNVLRIAIGATDFSTSTYTWADKQAGGVNATPADALANLSDEPAKKHLYPVLRDILVVNPDIRFMILPWSPPAWMKYWGTLEGGPLADNATNYVVEYLAQSAKAFQQSIGLQPWAISIQNEPSNPTSYPSALIGSAQEITLLSMLRGRMAELGMGSTKLVGLEDNMVYYSTALQLLNSNASAVDAFSWHCYNGSYDQIDTVC